MRLPGQRRFLLGLSLTAALLAVAFAIMLAVLMRQNRTVEEATRLQGDSITSLTFQLEREFLRLRSDLALTLRGRGRSQPDWETVTLRYEIFLSRVELLRDNPSTLKLRTRSEYQELMPHLEQLIADATPLLSTPAPHGAALERLLERLYQLGPDVQALSVASTLVVAGLIEEHVVVLDAQSTQIRWLIGAQVLLLMLAATGLLLRQRRQEQEQAALQALNAELAAARDLAEEANRSKSLFLANMSHELRTPFNGMLGMLDMLGDSPLDPQQRAHMQTARDSAQHLLRLLNDILDMSALESGRILIQPEPVNMRRLIGDVQQLMGSQAQHKGLEFVFEAPAQWPDWVETEPTRVRQILYNLLNNAIKFTDKGRVTLGVHCEPGPDGVLHWTFAVSDTGIGMDPATLAQLFQRFHQLDAGANRRFGGSGLGLEISRTLARLIGGDITVQSQSGQGSTFTLTLETPACAAPKTDPQSAKPEPPPAGGPSEPASPPLEILVAEDHPVNRSFIGTLLERLGHRASFAVNGREALEQVEQQDFDLILMDIHMPEMDGLEATQALRARSDDKRHIPVIALSADVMNEAQERALAAGIDEFLSKPVQKQQLQQALLRWSRQRH
jgi:signal transduction histidine kinase/ActR/RegA family two-component response regulator